MEISINISLPADDAAAVELIGSLLKAAREPAPAAPAAPKEGAKVTPPATPPEATPEPAPKKKAPKPEPKAEEKPAPKLPSRVEIKNVAVRKIQEGHRDAVKDLILAQGVNKIDEVPEAKLPAFVEALEKIGGLA